MFSLFPSIFIYLFFANQKLKKLMIEDTRNLMIDLEMTHEMQFSHEVCLVFFMTKI